MANKRLFAGGAALMVGGAPLLYNANSLALPETPAFEAGATPVPLELANSSTRTRQIAGFQADSAAMMAFASLSYDFTAVADGWWDDPATWGGAVPASDSLVKIPAGRNIWVRSDLTTGFIWHDGFLGFQANANVTVSAQIMCSRSSRVWIGEVGLPFNGRLDWEFPIITIDTGFDPRLQTNCFMSMGRTRAHGKEKDRFVFTDGTAVALGATSLTLAAAPSGWEVGDTIAIPPTHLVRPAIFGEATPDPGNQTETRVITAIDGATISWTAPLVYDHTVNANSSFSDIDIVNMSNNITFKSPPEALVHERGHVMLMFSFDHDWRYVSFENLGRTDKRADSWDYPDHPNHPNQGGAGVLATDSIKGRYSFHLHACGPDGDDTADSWEASNIKLVGLICSGSYSLGIAIHNSNCDVTNCASVNMWGAGLFTESGNETGYVDGFVAIGHKTGRQDISNKSAADAARHDWGHAQMIWMQGRLVPIHNWRVYGCSNGTGFVSNVRGAKEDYVRPVTLERRSLEHIYNYEHYFFGSDGENFEGIGLSTIVPIEVDGDNRVVACMMGAMVIKSGSAQNHYDYSHFNNVRASNVVRGIFFEYTGRYLCEGLEAIYDEDGAPGFAGAFEIGVHVGHEAFQFTLKAPHSVGFDYGVQFDNSTVPVEEFIDRRQVPAADWNNIILGTVTGSARTALIHPDFDTGENADKDRYVTLGELVDDPSLPTFAYDRIDIPNTEAAFNALQFWDAETDIADAARWSGTITDSAGSYSAPAGRDLCRYSKPVLFALLRKFGFWVESGTGDVFLEHPMIIGDRCKQVKKKPLIRVYFDAGCFAGDPRGAASPWLGGPWTNNGTKA
ncbi:MAG: hypothetical protein DHS20C05_19040 [Hyphococcus sp.]|nr:MAG: hypothetical protein DHS20C05_19040 [Marinicaulis sp.]